MRQFMCISFLVLTSATAYSFSKRLPSQVENGPRLDKVINDNLQGLDADPQKEQLLAFVKSLGHAKSSGQAAANLAKACEKKEHATFCDEIITAKNNSGNDRNRSKRAHLNLAKKDLEEWNKLNLNEVTRALGRHKVNKALSFASEIAEEKSCQSSALYTALGAHLEEKFPEKEYVETAMKMYQKSGECGKDESALRGQYRLGLLQVWQGQCENGGKTLSSFSAKDSVDWIDSRARYWASTCAQTGKRQPAAIDDKTKVLERFAEYPMSFHSIIFSIEHEDDLYAKVQAQPEPAVLFRGKDERSNLIVGLTEAAHRLNESEYSKQFISLLAPEDTENESNAFRTYTGVLYFRNKLSLSQFQLFSNIFYQDISYKTPASLKLMYPLWQYELVDAASKDLDSFLVLSLIRQESAFQTHARSPVGARGLMQIMPRTADMLNGKRLSPTKLYEPELNVKLGTKYMDRLLKRFDGNVFKVLAAYNAGALRVDDWSKRYPTDNDLLFMDLIPYKETRDYVAAILRNYYWYSRLYPELAKPQFAFWAKPDKKDVTGELPIADK